ncbi:MAG: DUF349 domain-containing protein, partial [Flavobacteriales bacterium]|nr:DUF349 domain-containing protein [Flavobacteriales bacterium]
MATKAELIAKLEQLLAEEELENLAEHVSSIKESYEALIAEAQRSQDEASEDPEDGNTDQEGERAPSSAEEQVPIESATLSDEDDKRFKQLLDGYHHQINEKRRAKAKEEAENLQAKQEVMAELKRIIAEEENIGNAFQQFNELQEKWKAIGPVPQKAYRDLQNDYSQLLDEFFYHIRIYKELRDHDLRKNTALKRALISDMEAVQRVDSVREAETLVKEYQDKWHQIGPVLKEEWEEVRDAFWNATRQVYDRIHEHYKVRRAEHESNLEAKQNLVTKVQTITEGIGELGTKEWRELTEKVLEAQNAWKSIGFATKKENERIWKEFRAECNAFFARKKAYFDGLKEQFREARESKQQLVKEAIALQDSTEWKRTADKLKDLQRKWKEAGSAGPRDEQKLWTQFRGACDHFFKARKANFAKLDEEQAVHVKEREGLIAEIENFQASGERNADMASLKAFSARWMECGRVSPKQFDALVKRYHEALDKQYDALKLEAEERRRMQYQDHLEGLRAAPDAKERMGREERIVKRKIEEMEADMRKMEENMGIFNFKSASGEAMRKEMEKKVERA